MESQNPALFPRDSTNKKVPVSVFCENPLHGEKINRHWLVWSGTAEAFVFFPALFLDKSII